MNQTLCALQTVFKRGRVLPIAHVWVTIFALVLGVLPADAQQITTDLSHGTSFQFQIAPGLPPFTFKVIPEVRESDDRGNQQSTVQGIEVYRGDSARPLQHLTGCEWSEMEPPPTGSDWFRTEDVNFDGYNDIYVMTTWGATGNQYGCVWLYNPATERFEYSKEFSELPRHWLDAASKTILTFDKGGAAGLVFDANKYKIDQNKPLLVWHEHQDWDFEKRQFHCLVEERKGTAMVTTRDDRSNPGDDWSDVTAPCDPSGLFAGSQGKMRH